MVESVPRGARDVHHRLSKAAAATAAASRTADLGSLYHDAKAATKMALPKLTIDREAVLEIQRQFESGSISLVDVWDQIEAKRLPAFPDIITENQHLKEEAVKVGFAFLKTRTRLVALSRYRHLNFFFPAFPIPRYHKVVIRLQCFASSKHIR